MDIYPQDLGRRAQDDLRRRRMQLPETAAPPSGPAARTVVLQRTRWTLFTIACWGALVSTLVFGLHIGVIFAVLTALFGALLGHFYIVFGRYLAHGPFPSRRSLAEKLSPLDISRLRKGADDGVEAHYCDLLMAAILTPPLADPGTEENARTAVRALGAAVEDLPSHDPNAIRDNSGELIVAAAGLAVDADHEPDPIIADSLRRRAEAMRHQAETVAWTVTATRRNHALRAEVAGQIDALRSSLVALSVGGAQCPQELTDLAGSIQTVAAAAHAIIAARAEWDGALAAEQKTDLTAS